MMVIVPYQCKDGYRICTMCHRELPATPEYFYRYIKGKFGLISRCKDCILGHLPIPQPKEGYKFCTKCGDELLATPEFFNRSKTGKYGLVSFCKKCSKVIKREYYHDHKEDNKIRCRANYQKNREKQLQQSAEYHQTPRGRDIHNRANRKYRTTKHGKKTNRQHKAKHRRLGYIEMFPNPFNSSEKVEWHHFYGAYVVALPNELHRLYQGKCHKDMCMNVLKQIYLW